MENYIGISYMDYDYTTCEVVAMRKNREYLVKDRVHTGANGCYSIRSKEDIENMLNLQDKLQESRKRSIERRKQEEEREEKERQLQAEKENLYGYASNKTPMQQGKILKNLMTPILFKNKIMTKKEYVIALLEMGYCPEYREYKQWTKNGIKDKKGYAMSSEKDNLFYDITKTEYDFINYYKEIV